MIKMSTKAGVFFFGEAHALRRAYMRLMQDDRFWFPFVNLPVIAEGGRYAFIINYRGEVPIVTWATEFVGLLEYGQFRQEEEMEESETA